MLDCFVSIHLVLERDKAIIVPEKNKIYNLGTTFIKLIGRTLCLESERKSLRLDQILENVFSGQRESFPRQPCPRKQPFALPPEEKGN